MRKHWIYAGIIILTIGLADSLEQRIIMAAGWSFLLNHIMEKKVRTRVFAIMMLFLLVSVPFAREIYSGRVIMRKDSYIVVRHWFSSVLVYTDDMDICIDDRVIFDGELEEITGYDNFETATFQSWAKGQNIYYSCTPSAIAVKDSGKTVRRWIYVHNRHMRNDWANTLLFGTGAPDGEYGYYFIQSGFHVSVLFGLLRKLLNRKLYKEDARKITVFSVLFVGALFHFPYAYIRTLISLLAETMFEDRRDRCGFQICALAMVKPNYIRSLSFLVPCSLRLLNAFKEKKNSLSVKTVMLMVILRIQGYCDLVSVFFFQTFRIIGSLFYGLAVVCSLLPFTVNMSNDIVSVLWYMERIPKLYINGRMPVLLIGIMIYVLDRYLVLYKRKYAVLLIVCFAINSFQSMFIPFYRITYLDVGQGDCALVQFPFSLKGLLIDTGGNPYKDVGSEIVIPFLRSRGVFKVDVIISHGDSDHAGALDSIQQGFRVGNVYEEKCGERIINGLHVYCPLYDRQYQEENNNSQIAYFKISDYGFLFLGDVSASVEEELTYQYNSLDVTVLKVAHHGSRTSTSDRLLSVYKMPFAVISAGRGNSYGHPHDEVLRRLNGYRVNVLSTKEDNAVEFMVFRWFMLYKTASGKTGIYLAEQ